MNRRPWFGWVSLGARLLLGVVMLVAGALKVTDPETAAQAVRAYELLPSALVEPVGWGLPFLEIAIGLLLIVGFGVRAAALAAGVLMIVFIAAVASAWARGLAIDSRPAHRRRPAEGRRRGRFLTHRVPIVTTCFWPVPSRSSSVRVCHV